jgi:pyruvate phosphate dikinase-like enzyme
MEARGSPLPRFGRRFFDPAERLTAIDSGSPGGKARGLLIIRDLLATRAPAAETGALHVDVPALTVIRTDAFDRFMHRNRLGPIVASDRSDAKLALAFLAADIPAELVGDLRALVEEVRSPLAVRSSSLLEDAVAHPFAGVYATKMIPNDQPDADTRFLRLVEAIKLVYASTFFKAARQYIAAAGREATDEKMAVIIQEVVGRRHGPRYYPDLSGVARSYSFYRSGTARPEDGFVSLALGLGKTIVDGGTAWNYSPEYPRANPPFASPSELLDDTQREFWAVSLGGVPRYDPTSEVEYLVRSALADAEADGTLRYSASTYDPSSDRLHPGLRGSGPRALTFAPLLVHDQLPLNAVVREMLSASEAALAAPVEIEFACTFPPGEPARFGFLQVRPMTVSSQPVVVTTDDLTDPACLVSSDAVLGNGRIDSIGDIVFVRRDRFDAARSRAIAADVAELNHNLVAERRPYLLIGFGRWGSADPWLGIPVDWSSIAGARAIVETTLPGKPIEPSQGSHFFHNLSSFGVVYFTVRPHADAPIAWAWLEAQRVTTSTEYAVHVRLDRPLRIEVDGRSGRGVIRRGGPEQTP